MTVNYLRSATVGLLVLAFCAGEAFAGNPTYTLDNVTITAKGPVPETSARSVITSSQIRASGATSVGAVLEQLAAVEINSVGPSGSVTSPSIRGATANEILVLIDGVPANNPLTGAVDLSTIPLNQVAQIDIIRGSAAAIYGPSAIGGVIDVITKKSVSAPLTVTFENGAFLPGKYSSGSSANSPLAGPDYSALVDSQRLALSGGGSVGKSSFAATGELKRAGNGYLYLDPTGVWRQLQNAALFGASGSLSVTRPVGGGKLAVRADANYQSHGDPGSESFPSPLAHEDDLTTGGTLQYHTPTFLSDLLDLSLALHGGYSQVYYSDPGSGTLSDHQLWTLSSSFGQSAYLGNDLTLGYGASASYNAVDSTSVGRRERLQGGGYLSPQLSLGPVSIRPSVRFDYLSDVASGALSVQLDVTDRVSREFSLWANAARSVRFPTIDDLYTPFAYGAVGNPSLGPETAWSANLGFGLTRGVLSYDLSVYARYAENLILWETSSGGIYTPINYGVALYPGVEQALSVRLPDHYDLRVSYSFLYSFALAGGLTLASDARMPMTPVHTVTASIEHTGSPFTWSLGGRFESSRLWIDNTTVLPPFLVVDAHLGWRFAPHWSSYLTANNLLGEQYQTEAGYPMPPAELRVGITARL